MRKLHAVGLCLSLALFAIAWVHSSNSATLEMESGPVETGDAAHHNSSEPAQFNMHCPQLHSVFPMDGLNIFKSKLIGYIAEIICAGRDQRIQLNVYMPPLLSHGYINDKEFGPQRLVPFESVFDIEALKKYLENANVLNTNPVNVYSDTTASKPLPVFEVENVYPLVYNGGIGGRACQTPNENLPPVSTVCNSQTAALRDGDAIGQMTSIAGRQGLLDIIQVLATPAKLINDISESFMHSNPGSEMDSEYMCVHLRIEEDFSSFFHAPPAYYDMDNYIRKIQAHKIKSPGIYKNIKNIFIAGDHLPEMFKEKIRPFFQKLVPEGKVVGHADLRVFALVELENIQRAALDQSICAKSKVFVGNNRSGWSEHTHFQRAATAVKGVRPEYVDMLDFMVNNDSDSPGSSDGPMNHFRGANHAVVFG